MYKYDLSIILPSIRTHLLQGFYDSVKDSIGDCTYELIVVGPNSLPPDLQNRTNVKYIKDLGHPARCGQIGATLAEGKFMTWSSDDALYQPHALENCIDLLSFKGKMDAIIIRYYEGINRVGNLPDDSYWIAHTHADLRLSGIPSDSMIAPVAMYYTSHFIKMGGWDTRFEHLNMNCHDLAFRIQSIGGKFYLSPDLVMICDQMPGYTGDHRPIEDAYWKNDKELFNIIYSTNYPSRRADIDVGNWKNSPAVWERRFQ